MTDRQDAQALVETASQELGGIDIPARLREQVARQQDHLLELASSMLSSGLDEATVRDVIDRALASYRDELVATIVSLGGEGHA